jgi:hypothetical protein
MRKSNQSNIQLLSIKNSTNGKKLKVNDGYNNNQIIKSELFGYIYQNQSSSISIKDRTYVK